jgi:YVTN family beta-propeller protein
VWVTDDASTLSRIDPTTSAVTDAVDMGDPAQIFDVAVGYGAVWVTKSYSHESYYWVVRVNPHAPAKGETASVDVGDNPVGVAVGGGAVWVANTDDNTVSRVDPARNAVTATVAVGKSPNGIAVGGGGVWVANAASDTVSRVTS